MGILHIFQCDHIGTARGDGGNAVSIGSDIEYDMCYIHANSNVAYGTPRY
jgi:hypothetical protein